MGFQRGIQLLKFKFMNLRCVSSVGVSFLIHQLLTSSIFQFLGLFAHTHTHTPSSSRSASILVNDPSISKRSYKINTTNKKKVVDCLLAMSQFTQKKSFNNCWCFRNQQLTQLSLVARTSSTSFIPTGFIKTNLRWWSWCSLTKSFLKHPQVVHWSISLYWWLQKSWRFTSWGNIVAGIPFFLRRLAFFKNISGWWSPLSHGFLNDHQSGQIIIVHQPGKIWNKETSPTKLPFGVRSCEVVIIWPDQ